VIGTADPMPVAARTVRAHFESLDRPDRGVVVAEIRHELANPAQPLRLALPGLAADEAALKAFLTAVADGLERHAAMPGP
jgi:hypothetical protein